MTNPNDAQKAIPMSSSPETPNSPPGSSDPPPVDGIKESDPPLMDAGDIKEALEKPEGETKLKGEEEEEEAECGFCLFMKGGGCKDSFIDWEKCIEDAEKKGDNIVDKCFEVTSALKKCMEAHSNYYEQILHAEKAAEAEAVQELEKEKAKEAAQASEKEREMTEKEAAQASEEEKEMTEKDAAQVSEKEMTEKEAAVQSS